MYLTILLFFFLQSGVKGDSTLQDDCDKMKVEYSATDLNAGQNVKIELIVKGGSEPFYYFFFDSNNNPLNWNFTQSYCTAAKSAFPKYVKILDSSGCSKMIEFNERANP